jgi:hypothetical protein
VVRSLNWGLERLEHPYCTRRIDVRDPSLSNWENVGRDPTSTTPVGGVPILRLNRPEFQRFSIRDCPDYWLVAPRNRKTRKKVDK